MAKKGWIIFGMIAILGTAGLGSWQFYFKDKFASSSGGDEIAFVTKVSNLTAENLGIQNWYAGVVEAQNTVKVNIESGRTVSETKVSVGDSVKVGDVLFEYDLSNLQDDLKKATIEMEKLKNAAVGHNQMLASYQVQIRTQTPSEQLSTLIAIEDERMSLRQNELDQIKKQAEIDKLYASSGNAQVFSTVDGVIQKIDTSKLSSSDGSTTSDNFSFGASGSDSDAFITILGTGNYRVKGTVNEQNRSDIVMGTPVIIRSRADSTQIWHGAMGTIDERNASSGATDNWGMTSSDSSSNSSSYPFYVNLENSDNLMLGQHVYIERDEGQSDRGEGLWLSEYYIADADTDAPYIWAVGTNGKLEKRSLVLGEYDEGTLEYQILKGLDTTDSVTAPTEDLREGMPTADISERPEIEEIEEYSDEEYNLESQDEFTFDGYAFGDGDFIDDTGFTDDFSDFDMDFGDEEFMSDTNVTLY
ncbi:MAG: efflux RND transporter periplasmic adaptor subunit [Blautia sp.]|nr:efflux RND transporter periplasmic adaptor subunit [Blautia sp.]